MKGYDCQTLMESFDTNCAILAAHLKFDPKTFVVSSEFVAVDDFLDNVDAEYPTNDEDFINGQQVEMEIEPNAEKELVQTLLIKMEMNSRIIETVHRVVQVLLVPLGLKVIGQKTLLSMQRRQRGERWNLLR